MKPQPLRNLIPGALSAQTTIPRSSPSTSGGWQPDLDAYEPSLARAVELVVAFVRDIEDGRTPYTLTLSGVCGCGKTLLARQLFEAAAKRNPHATGPWTTGVGTFDYTNRRPLSFWMAETLFADRTRSDFAYPESLRGDFLVALDDLGAARDRTEFLTEALYRLFSLRAGKWNIVTTNLSLAEIAAKVDGRIASRLIRDGGVFFRIAAGDYAVRRALAPTT